MATKLEQKMGSQQAANLRLQVAQIARDIMVGGATASPAQFNQLTQAIEGYLAGPEDDGRG